MLSNFEHKSKLLLLLFLFFYRGEIPKDLPAAQTHECRVCNVSVKYLKEHLKNAHKITEHEYESLFDNDPDTKVIY